MEDEATYICDSCGEEIVIPIDPSAGAVSNTSKIAPFVAIPTSCRSKSTNPARFASGASTSSTRGHGPRGDFNSPGIAANFSAGFNRHSVDLPEASFNASHPP